MGRAVAVAVAIKRAPATRRAGPPCRSHCHPLVVSSTTNSRSCVYFPRGGWGMQRSVAFYFSATRISDAGEIAGCSQHHKQQKGRVVENDGSFGGLSKLCEEGRLDEAIQAVDLMDQRGIRVSTDIFYCLLKGCINKKDLAAGREVHSLIMRSGFESNAFLGSQLVRMFALCGSLLEANQVFSKLPEPGVYAWGAVISAHAKHGQGEQAIKLYHQMQQLSVRPDEYVFVAVLTACASAASLTQGKLIHEHIIESGFESDVFVGNTLIDMYAKCGSLKDARRVFNKLSTRDLVSWNAMIAGYAHHGHGQEALQLFQQMQEEGMDPNNVTFVSILKACANIAALDQGKLIHARIIETGFESHISVGNTLINMYAKCGSLEDARRVFNRLPKRNVMSCNAMITGYVQHGHGQEALQLFQQMQEEGMDPNKVTFASILKACSSRAALDQGKLIHARIIESGFELDVFVGSTLIDMYSKCGSFEDARRVFDRMPKRNVVTWSAMIAGCSQHGLGQEALQLFQQMQEDGVDPNIVTFVSILKACSSIAAIDQGKLIHARIIESGFESDVFVGSTLIDMYAKCGSLEDARSVFDRMPKRNVVTWSAMIAGYARHSDWKMVLQYFEDMQQQGLKPDDVTFVCLLSACSHMGLVDEGCKYFKSMSEDHGITPTIEHHNCMVDLLGRAGRLNEAEDLLQTMPMQPNIVGWMSLLSACRTYGNVVLGRRCFDRVVTMDHRHGAGYMLLSNIYADAHMWEHVDKIQELRKCARAWKKPGKALIEINNKVHDFIVGDKSHPQSDDIYAKLKRLNVRLKEEGYVPHLDSVLQPKSDEDKEDALCGHCEKLAIAFGLISTPGGTTIRLTKNLRVCADCHSATKIISKIERREIIVRDGYRIHHFNDGTCSCGDYY